jgi:hypothetical protein
MISILTYIVLTYISFKFVLWLFNINIDDNSIREFKTIKINKYSLKNQKIFKNFNINDFQLNLKLKDRKINDIFYETIHKTIYKNHLQVRVNSKYV